MSIGTPGLPEPGDHLVEPGASRISLPCQRRLERLVVRVDADPEHVDLALGDVVPVPADDGVDLDPGTTSRPSGISPERRSSRTPASVSWSVMARRRTPAARAAVDELPGREDPVRAERVGVEVGDRGRRRHDPAERRLVAAFLRRGNGAGGGREARRRIGPAHSSQTRWTRSIASARPVAGSMSIWVALNTTGPSATSKRVGRPVRNRGSTVAGSKPMIDQAPPVQPEVALVGRALGQDPVVGCRDVGVRAHDRGDPPVEVHAHRVLLGRDLAVEVDQADGRQRLAGLLEEPIGLEERVLDRLHVRPALEVDDRQLRAVERVVGPPPSPGNAVRAVVQRSEDPVVRLEDRVDLLLVPDVIARGDDVDAMGEQRVGGRWRQAHPAGEVLAVGGDEVDRALLAEGRNEGLDREPAGLADDVTDHEHATGAGGSRGPAVGGIAEPDATRGALLGVVCRHAEGD